jgi:hypothetical protein
MSNKPMPTPAMTLNKEDLDRIADLIADPRFAALWEAEVTRYGKALLSILISKLMDERRLDV